MAERELKLCGWGYAGDGLGEAERATILHRLAALYGVDPTRARTMPDEADIPLHAPRLAVPAALGSYATADRAARLRHTYGKSYPDYLRQFDADYTNAPDIVATPGSEAEIAALFDWAAGARAAVVPFGGGTSVVGGIEPAVGSGYAGTVSLDLTRLDRVVEIDRVGRCARIQGGARVPAFEAALRPHGMTMRHFPQSFEMATLGGMIATRSGGHFATLYTHIDEFVQSLRTVTPAGVMESRRLPGSGAGPSPDRFVVGSEGSIGVITEAWMRLQERPRFRGSAVFLYDDIYVAAEAVRAVSQAGLYPANLRVIDADEAALSAVPTDGKAALILAFESADHPLDAWLARAVELCRDHGGVPEPERADGPAAHREGIAGAWREAFIRMPHGRPLQVALNVVNDTFETAIPWDRFREFHDGVRAATLAAVREATGRPGHFSCRFTHVYPDGPAPYFTFEGIGRPGALMAQWRHIKQAASQAVIDLGGTITHHHAVGRDHMPWYVQQRPDLFGAALQAAKARLDPAGIMNPGVIVPAPVRGS